jgi:hypothetical protein
MTGGTQAELIVDSGGQRTRREPTTKVTGSGAMPPPAQAEVEGSAEPSSWLDDESGVALRSGATELVLRRDVRPMPAPAGWASLHGTWPDRPASDEPVLLAVAH